MATSPTPDTMVRQTTTLLLSLALVLALTGASVTPTASSTSSTAAAVRGRGARKAFIGRGGSARPRVSPAPTRAPVPPSSTFATTLTTSPAVHLQTSASASFAPTLPPFQSTFPQTLIRVPAPTAAPRAAPRADALFVAPRRPAAPPVALGFGPPPRPFATQAAQGGRPRATPVPIVALKFNLRDDGSYSTSSETGDGTVRQEQGQFNGAAMSVQGMYAYRDLDQGPVQVRYVADEYGFQPQGPNIHPAIMMAVAEQVQAARSSKARQGGRGLNALERRADGELDYDDDNGAGTTPASAKLKASRAVRRVVVRRLRK